MSIGWLYFSNIDSRNITTWDENRLKEHEVRLSWFKIISPLLMVIVTALAVYWGVDRHTQLLKEKDYELRALELDEVIRDKYLANAIEHTDDTVRVKYLRYLQYERDAKGFREWARKELGEAKLDIKKLNEDKEKALAALQNEKTKVIKLNAVIAEERKNNSDLLSEKDKINTELLAAKEAKNEELIEAKEAELVVAKDAVLEARLKEIKAVQEAEEAKEKVRETEEKIAVLTIFDTSATKSRKFTQIQQRLSINPFLLFDLYNELMSIIKEMVTDKSLISEGSEQYKRFWKLYGKDLINIESRVVAEIMIEIGKQLKLLLNNESHSDTELILLEKELEAQIQWELYGR